MGYAKRTICVEPRPPRILGPAGSPHAETPPLGPKRRIVAARPQQNAWLVLQRFVTFYALDTATTSYLDGRTGQGWPFD